MRHLGILGGDAIVTQRFAREATQKTGGWADAIWGGEHQFLEPIRELGFLAHGLLSLDMLASLVLFVLIPI